MSKILYSPLQMGKWDSDIGIYMYLNPFFKGTGLYHINKYTNYTRKGVKLNRLYPFTQIIPMIP